jgi:2-methylisocitrate lyase-like PEP mutase family enzyme
MNNKVTVFRSLHKLPTPLLLANAWDVASARIAEDLGATAIATTSAGVAWSLGYRDGGVLPAGLQVQLAQRINRVINIPLSMDMENGYSSDPIQVAENIKPLLDAGVAGINIEDGSDKPELLVAKIEAIRNTTQKYGVDLFINARTDVYLAALVPEDRRLAEVAVRLKQYAEVGADGIFVPYTISEKDIAEIVKMTTLPINVLAHPDLPKAGKLADLGVKRLSAGSGVFQVIWQHVSALTREFLKEGDSAVLVNDSMEYPKIQELFSDKTD